MSLEAVREARPKAPPEVPIEAPIPLPTKHARGRRPFAILGLAAALLLGGLGTYAILTAGEENTDDAQVSSDLVPVGTRVAGQVTRVLIQEDQTVHKGDLLLEIDDADFIARADQARADLQTAQAQADSADAQVEIVEAMSRGGLVSAKASYSGSSAGVSSAEAQIAAARAQVQRSEADLHKAEIDLARMQKLQKAAAVSQERLDNAQIAYDTAQAAQAQAQAQLAAAQDARQVARTRVREAQGRLSQSEPIDAQIAQAHAGAKLAHARVKSAEAALLLARQQLSYTKILAPSDGLASKVAVHDGQLVTAGQSVLDLVPTATYVVANFKETQVGKMRPGQRAAIEIDAFPHRKFAAEVTSLSGGTGSSFSLMPADNASGNFVKVVQRVPVRLRWLDPPGDVVLRAGMSADVTVKVGR